MSEAISELEIREKLTRIDQLTADADLKQQEFELGIRKFWISAITAAAALLGAGGALTAATIKWFGG